MKNNHKCTGQQTYLELARRLAVPRQLRARRRVANADLHAMDGQALGGAEIVKDLLVKVGGGGGQRAHRGHGAGLRHACVSVHLSCSCLGCVGNLV
jgi:hypothetical protein